MGQTWRKEEIFPTLKRSQVIDSKFSEDGIYEAKRKCEKGALAVSHHQAFDEVKRTTKPIFFI